MLHLRRASAFVVLASLLSGFSLADSAHGGNHGHFARHHAVQCREYQYGKPDLFYNYFVPPTCGGVGAQLYVAPLPVPAHVGHTYFTYQPFFPHEFMYHHYRAYHRYYDEGRGLTRTSVRWW